MAEEKRITIELKGFSNILWLLFVMAAFAIGFMAGAMIEWWKVFQLWANKYHPVCLLQEMGEWLI